MNITEDIDDGAQARADAVATSAGLTDELSRRLVIKDDAQVRLIDCLRLRFASSPSSSSAAAAAAAHSPRCWRWFGIPALPCDHPWLSIITTQHARPPPTLCRHPLPRPVSTVMSYGLTPASCARCVQGVTMSTSSLGCFYADHSTMAQPIS